MLLHRQLGGWLEDQQKPRGKDRTRWPIKIWKKATSSPRSMFKEKPRLCAFRVFPDSHGAAEEAASSSAGDQPRQRTRRSGPRASCNEEPRELGESYGGSTYTNGSDSEPFPSFPAVEESNHVRASIPMRPRSSRTSRASGYEASRMMETHHGWTVCLLSLHEELINAK